MNQTISFIVETYRRQLVSIIIFIVALGVLSFIVLKFSLLGSSNDTSLERVEVAVVDALPEDTAVLSPYIYFSALGTTEAGVRELHTYVYDITTGNVEPVSIHDGDHSFSYVDDRHALFVGRSWDHVDETHPDHWTPIWSDYGDGMHGLITTASGWNEVDLVAHPGGQYIAYVQQPELADDERSRSLETWELVIAKPESGDVRRIPGASSPQWVGANYGMVYLKTDGIYYTTASSDTEVKIFDGYRGLTRNADLAAAKDGSYLVVTVPGARALEVLQVEAFELGKVSVVYTHTNESVVYRHPVFDAGAMHFATVHFVSGVPQVEIRSVMHDAIVAEFTLPAYEQAYFALNDWTDIRMTAAQYAQGTDDGHHDDTEHNEEAAE